MPNSASTPEPQTEAAAPAAPGGWSTPDFTVVDTAMEVTAYSLNTL
ncbi:MULTISPECIES: pyrroloquinoline quinone precursor peptide PqqA [unclassified Streptomyces]